MKNRNITGFTLIELLAVMGIVILISGVVASSYFGITRGFGMRSAVSHLRSTLMLARQMALINGRRVVVVFDQNSTNSMYVVCEYAGEVTDGSTPDQIGDEYAEWDGLENTDENFRVYNLRTGQGARLVDFLDVTPPAPIKQSAISGIYYMKTDQAIWAEGDGYGWAIGLPAALPKGIQFYRDGAPNIPEHVVFEADGSSKKGHDINIDIVEMIRANSGDPMARIIVRNLTGLVDVDLSKRL